MSQYNTTVYLETGGDKLVIASGGEIEVQSGGTVDFQGSVTFIDDTQLIIGTGTDCALEWDTNQTQDALLLGLGASNTLIVLEKADMTADKALAAATYPQIIIYDANADNYMTLGSSGDDIALVGSSNDIDIRCGLVAGDALNLQAYDVGVTTYEDMITLASHATLPTMILHASGGITANAGLTLSDAAGTGAGSIVTVEGEDLGLQSTDATTAGDGGDVNVIAGAGDTAGAGGDVDLNAGAGAAGVGGNVELTAGAGNGAFAGGTIDVDGGTGGAAGAGGAVTIDGGAPASGTADGGAVTITGGTAGATGGTGGEVTLAGGAIGGGAVGGITLNGTVTLSDQAGTAGGIIDAVAGQSLSINVSDNVATALDIQEAANDYITVNTLNDFEEVEFGVPVDMELGQKHETYFEIFDDFLYQAITENDTPWILNAGTDTEAIDAAILATQENGVIRLTTGDASGVTAADASQIVCHIPMQADNGGLVFETRLNIDTAITDISVNAGFTDSTALEEPFTIAAGTVTAVANDAACFTYDTDSTVDQFFMCAVDSTVQDAGNATTGTAPVADVFNLLRIEVSADGSEIKFFIDGVLEGTLTGDVGVSPDVNLFATVVVNSTTTTSKSADVDFVYAGVLRG